MLPPHGSVFVMAGPGNNGGDGLVAARILEETGYRAEVALLGDRSRLSGEAATAAEGWGHDTVPLTARIPPDADLIIDALFGNGLDRAVEGVAQEAIDAANACGLPILAVDLPSGIHGLTGRVLGTAIRARQTVTFFRPKAGLLLQPGRSHAGRIVVADIGIEAACLEAIHPLLFHNTPPIWSLPRPAVDGHKYGRGHTVVVSGGPMRTGAARLAARGALRAGSGLVTVASPPEALPVNAMHLTAIMLLAMEGPDGLAAILADPRKNVVVMGPALGVGRETAALVEGALSSNAAAVLDADALTSFADGNEQLFEYIAGRSARVVMTPHEGEFERLFPSLTGRDSKVERARDAAVLSGAVVVLKGPDTVVAAPDGRAAIADNAPADLATAGAGDVLAGIIGGLLAQGMPAFEAAAAAVFIHGEAGRVGGRGLIAEDLPEALPAVLQALAP
jgi:hydroxyethylthiazole kinase-like uncharacterized protein yjeF